jgi:hypothetical protein
MNYGDENRDSCLDLAGDRTGILGMARPLDEWSNSGVSGRVRGQDEVRREHLLTLRFVLAAPTDPWRVLIHAREEGKW